MTRNVEATSVAVGVAPIGTAVVWIGCLAVGMTGILLPVIPTASPVKPMTPVQAVVIHVELSQNASPSPNAIPQPNALVQPATPPPTVAPAAPPPMAAVAEPNASIAFAVPTSAPARTVSAAAAIPSRATNTNAAPVVQRLTYGQGEGAQPKPEYPPDAKIAHQQGVVLVRFTIGEDGSVTSAEAIEPSPFPMLNQSAVRTIREDWRFEPGAVRVREIPIEFDLRQH